ncbi:hypothetical protein GCM10028868_22540 [Virgibacillus kimchii]
MLMENSNRHTEIMREFKSINADQEFTWKKAVQNEREIAKIKGQFMGK